MTQFHRQSDRSAEPFSVASYQRQKPNLRFWLFLLGGSILLHLLLIQWVGAILRPSLRPTVATPIDLIHLDDHANGSGRAKNIAKLQPLASPAPNPKPLPAKAPQTAQPIAAQSGAAPKLKQPAPVVAHSQPLAVSHQVANVIAAAIPAASELTPLPLPSPLPSTKPRLPAVASAAPLPAPSPPAAPTAALPDANSPQMPPVLPTALPTVLPTPTPLIVAQPITQPVPDISQPQPEDEPLASGVVTDQPSVPSYLVANLTAASLPAEQVEQPAQPQVEVQRFLTNSQLPPCDAPPEIVYFLGKPVILRVTTNATGQVMQTATERSSQNLAYDDLASCLVRNWSFKPAISQGKPVTDPGLLVRITIDRS